MPAQLRARSGLACSILIWLDLEANIAIFDSLIQASRGDANENWGKHALAACSRQPYCLGRQRKPTFGMARSSPVGIGAHPILRRGGFKAALAFIELFALAAGTPGAHAISLAQTIAMIT